MVVAVVEVDVRLEEEEGPTLGRLGCAGQRCTVMQ